MNSHLCSETAVQRARRDRSAPTWKLSQQLDDASKGSAKDAIRREIDHSKAAERDRLEAAMATTEDFELAGPNLMRRAKQRSKARGRDMANAKQREHQQAAATFSSPKSSSIHKAMRRVKSKFSTRQGTTTMQRTHCLCRRERSSRRPACGTIKHLLRHILFKR
jgi:hypothetical protein